MTIRLPVLFFSFLFPPELQNILYTCKRYPTPSCKTVTIHRYNNYTISYHLFATHFCQKPLFLKVCKIKRARIYPKNNYEERGDCKMNEQRLLQAGKLRTRICLSELFLQNNSGVYPSIKSL